MEIEMRYLTINNIDNKPYIRLDWSNDRHQLVRLKTLSPTDLIECLKEIIALIEEEIVVSREQQFEEAYLNKHMPDEEYEHYLNLWLEYRKQTDWMPQSMSKEAWKIHQSLFGGLPKNDKYQKAKTASLIQR